MRLRHCVGIIAFHSAVYLTCSRSFAIEPTKPIQECEQEFQAREASLRSEGITAASFFHECWWHSRQGHPTDISSGAAKDRAQRVQRDPGADRLWTQSKATAQSATGYQRISASLIDRRAKRREARLQRRMNRIIAARAQLVLAARARHQEGKRVSVADAREIARRLIIKKERLAALSRRNSERRERYALSRSNRRPAETSVVKASIDIPANAVDGRRSWIGTDTGPVKIPAVLIGDLQSTAVKGMALHCWGQNVLYLSGKARWQQSLVCDNKTEAGAQKIWFEQYDASR